MDLSFIPQVAVFAGVGIVVGCWLLVRGMGGYRTALRIGDTSTSTVSSLAAGEVRVSGAVEAAEVTLVSPLQSVPCIYYRASVRGDDDVSDLTADLSEERAVGFRVRDDSGVIRVFPRGARWDAPLKFDDRTGSFGEEPPGLSLRTGGAVATMDTDRDAAISRLLSVQVPEAEVHPLLRGVGTRQSRRYQEWRVEVGDAVTVVGRAIPFSDLQDPTEADVSLGADLAWDDPEVAANIAEARAAGILVDDPEEAWGNAAIPGFGIGRPTRLPDLDPAADRPTVTQTAAATSFEQTFAIPPETLVLVAAPAVPLLIAHGVPGAAVERHENRFIIGLLGAILAIASAVAFAVMLGGGFDS